MDTHKTDTSGPRASWSLYGYDLINCVRDYGKHLGSAHEAARYVLTHGGSYPIEQALHSLALLDRAAFDVFEAHPDVPLASGDERPQTALRLCLSVNTLGRLHIRPPAAQRPQYFPQDQWLEIGTVDLTDAMAVAITAKAAAAEEREAQAFREIKRAMDALEAQGGLPAAVELAADSIQHIDNVCFYIGDRFYALMERYANLIDTKSGPGCLSRLSAKEYDDWTPDELLIVAAFQALFLSGGAGRFEEFNGARLSASGLVEKLHHLRHAYCAVTATDPGEVAGDIFEIAADIGKRASQAIGKPWLRYRWIYGLNFLKVERILPSTRPTESASAHYLEFEDDFHELVSARRQRDVPSSLFFAQLASACLARDLAGVECGHGSDAATGWLEYLIERIVASAVRAVGADYGMSSSLKDYARLVEHDDAALVKTIHALSPADFFTCFVSRDFKSRFDADTANTIAVSVQKRMMFNRWHFIPGNLERGDVAKSRHWFYPPVVPDIAAHSNMHRLAHSRAAVKYSIRAPGPDLSRPALQIAGRPYRGIYDIRVVRMDGLEFGAEELLRARRRTLWMEALYSVLSLYLQSADAQPFVIKGFPAGTYLDLPRDGEHLASKRAPIGTAPPHRRAPMPELVTSGSAD
jgi:hypothetical protein